jgi:hypothetical protein
MQSKLLLLAAASVVTPFLAAQNKVVSPEAMTNASGGIHNSIPWGPFASTALGEGFQQQIYDDLQGTPRVFKGFAFRPQWNVAHVAKTYDVKITLADAATPSTGISTTFANNYKTGGAKTVVFDGNVTFPARSALPRPPAPFTAAVLFTTPHAYTGLDPLLAETFIRSTTPVSPTHFFERGPGSTHTAGPVGNGCNATGQTSPMNAIGTTTRTTITNSVSLAPASALAALWLGDTGSMWGPFTLPVDLVILGSPGCFVNINLVLPVLGTLTSASGTASSSLPYTLNPSNSGVRFRTQWFAVDGGTIRSSNGLDHSTPHGGTGLTWPQGRVYATGFGTALPPTGSLQASIGLVTEWSY